MTDPLVSVIIPCYNQGQFLAEAIDSVLAQTYPHVEIIVVNDGSTDNTVDVAASYGDKIKYIWQENSGVSVARNRGILESRGDYLQFLDADDLITPLKLSQQLEAFFMYPEVGVVYSEGRYIDDTGVDQGPVALNHGSGWVFHRMLSLDQTVIHAPLLRRQYVAAAGLFDASLPAAEDADFWVRMAQQVPFLALPYDHFRYRVRGISRSKNWPAVLDAHLEILRRYRATHGRCKECRRALTAGRKRWLGNCTYEIMKEARALWTAGQKSEAGEKLAWVLRHNPWHLARLLAPQYIPGKVALLLRLGRRYSVPN